VELPPAVVVEWRSSHHLGQTELRALCAAADAGDPHPITTGLDLLRSLGIGDVSLRSPSIVTIGDDGPPSAVLLAAPTGASAAPRDVPAVLLVRAAEGHDRRPRPAGGERPRRSVVARRAAPELP
jgi:hypothetical protein